LLVPVSISVYEDGALHPLALLRLVWTRLAGVASRVEIILFNAYLVVYVVMHLLLDCRRFSEPDADSLPSKRDH
jgi:hypothetical protein